MTPEERDLAKKRAIAKARARARAAAGPEMGMADAPQIENRDTGQQPPSHHADQLSGLGKLDSFFDGWGGRGTAAGLQAGSSLTLGGLDRGLAGLDAIAPGGPPKLPGRPRDSLGQVREFRQGLRDKHPTSAFAGEMVGAVGAGLPLDDAVRHGTNQVIKRLPQGKGLLKEALRYGARGTGLAAEGLAQFGLWKAGVNSSNKEAETGEDMSLTDRAQSVVENPNELGIAAAAGPVMSAGYRAGRGLVTGRMTPKGITGGLGSSPSVEAIEGMKNEAYKMADELGVSYSPDSYQNLIAGIETKLSSEGIDPVLHQRASRTLQRMQDRVGDQPMTMQELDKIRQFVRRDVIQSAAAGATPGANAGEQRLGMMMVDAIDDFIESGAGATTGAAKEGGEAILRARSLNTVWRKSQTLQDAFENAHLRSASTGSGGNFENALRQELRKIYQNPKKIAGFNEAERKMMRTAIEGNAIQNTQRLLGKFSPEGNGLMGMMGVGGTVANPLFAAVPIGGFIAKRMSEKGIKKNFENLDELVRSGADNAPQMKNITPPKTPPPPGGPTPAAAVAASQGKPVANGLDIPYLALQERGTLAGMGGGASYGAHNPEDMDGDGDIDNKDVLLTSLVYSGYGGLAGRTAKGISRKLTGTKPITNAQYLKSQAIVTTKNPGLASNTPEFESLVKQDLNQRGYVGDMPGAAAVRKNSELSQEQQIGMLVSNWTDSGQPLAWQMPKLVQSVGFKRAMETAEKAILKRHPEASRELVARKIIENSDLKGTPEAQDYLSSLANPKWNSQAGAINIGGGPQRRKDLLKEAMSKSQGAPVEGITQPSRRADPSLNAPYAEGPPGGPLPLLAGVGAAGVAGTYAYDQLTHPKATVQPPEPRPPVPQSFGPSVKPDLSGVQQASTERANMDARAQDQAERQEYWQYLKSRGDGSSIEWNRIQQERAGELSLKPEDIARGVTRKRLPYVYGSTPVSVLSEAPIEELIDGHWRPVEPSPATVR